MRISSALKALAYVWRAKKIWSTPKQAKTVIYDRCGSEVFLEYIDGSDAELLDVRGESINVYVLFKCILSLKLSLSHYFYKYIADESSK